MSLKHKSELIVALSTVLSCLQSDPDALRQTLKERQQSYSNFLSPQGGWILVLARGIHISFHFTTATFHRLVDQRLDSPEPPGSTFFRSCRTRALFGFCLAKYLCSEYRRPAPVATWKINGHDGAGKKNILTHTANRHVSDGNTENRCAQTNEDIEQTIEHSLDCWKPNEQ